MATRAQLREHDELKKEHKEAVEAVNTNVERSLSIARAQLAASIASTRDVSADITERDGFDPDHPENVLTSSEVTRLTEATVIVNALRDYVSGTLRLQSSRGPFVRGDIVVPGRV